MYRKATLRRMPLQTRQYARLLNDLESVLRRGKNMVVKMSSLELDSRALAHARERGAITTLSMPQSEDEPGFEV